MKRYVILILTIIFLSSCASNTTFHSYYKSNKKQTEFRISSPAFLAKMFIPKEDTQEFQQILRKIRHFKVMVFEEGGDYQLKKFDKFSKRNGYSSIVKVKEDGTNVEVFFLKRKSFIKEIVFKVKDDQEFVLVGLKSNISEADFEQFIEDTEISARNSR